MCNGSCVGIALGVIAIAGLALRRTRCHALPQLPPEPAPPSRPWLHEPGTGCTSAHRVNFDDDQPWVDVSPDLHEALNEWSQILDGCWSAWRAIGRQMGAAPSPVSPVGVEDAALASIRPSWGPHEAWQCAVQAAQLMDGASQHLLGLKALVDKRQLVLPPWPVVRAEIEHLARGAWILDPQVGPKARVARCWMERLHGAHRRKWALDATRAPGPDIRAARRHRDETRDELQRRFEDADLPSWTMQDKQPEWSVLGEGYPSIGRACRRFEKMGGFKRSHGMYDVLAATSRPS